MNNNMSINSVPFKFKFSFYLFNQVNLMIEIVKYVCCKSEWIM